MTVTINGSTGIVGATWTTAGRPSSPAVGQRGFNTTINGAEIYNGDQWNPMSNGFSATGGTKTRVGGYTIHTFLSSGTFTPDFAGEVEYLVVAGGGGGGGYCGGGGGAGGFRTATGFAVAATGLTVTVGAGGAGGNGVAVSGSQGSNSVFSTITSVGGGYGAHGTSALDGGAGGSGGGATKATTASGTAGQGNSGGAGTVASSQGGGGGGGAGAAGGTGVAAAGGDGGAGAYSNYSGSIVPYAGGGGGGNGGTKDIGGAGGSGGGGTGTGDTSPVNAGTANTGGGGGGAGYPTTSPGGAGGSGIVIIRYPTAGTVALITPETLQIIKLQTAVATTSGTSIDFTSIPAGVKRISVHFVGVSTNGGSDYLIQIGDTGGIETSGYLGSSGRLVTGTNGLAYTAGFAINNGTQAASYVTHGSMVLSLVKSSTFTWAANGVFGGSDSYTNTVSGGSKSTSAELDRVRLTTVNGSDVFDAGLVNISWEF